MGKAPEVTASNVQAAAVAAKDALATYKKKMFYRRLKVIGIGTTALTLLLAGCLLGFVLPATIHPTGPIRANASSPADSASPSSLVNPDNGLTKSFPESNDTTTTVPVSKLSTESSSKNVSGNSIQSNNTSSRTTRGIETFSSTPKMSPPTTTVRTSTTQPPVKTTKWWLVKIHDQMSELKRKHAMQRTTTTTTPRPTTTTTTTTMKPPTTALNHAHKLWLNRWREHVVENSLQKKKLGYHNNNNNNNNNNTGYGGNVRTPAAVMESDDKSEIQLETTLATWEDVKNQLTGNLPRPLNLTSRSNVRRVTSYPQLNITTTAPSVITRKV